VEFGGKRKGLAFHTPAGKVLHGDGEGDRPRLFSKGLLFRHGATSSSLQTIVCSGSDILTAHR
jgi:hypothetical protein